MGTRWIVLGLLPLLVACGGGATAETASYTLCDCVNHPPNTDAKLAACNDLITAMDPGDLAAQSIECKRQIPVPAGGPDACYCLTAESDDPSVREACQIVMDEMGDVTTPELMSLVRSCSAKRVLTQ